MPSRTVRPTRSAGLALLLLGPALLGFAGCGPADASDRPASASADTSDEAHTGGHAAHATAATAMDAAPAADFSIYHAESVWTDQHGRERRLESLAGRVQVVAMLYTSCAYACPRIMLDMKRIEGELGEDAGSEVGFVVVSIDPERDTPERLAEFATGSRLDPDRWTLLTGDEGDVLELAALLGVRYRQTAPGEWVHSNLITVLDAQGEVIHRQLGLGTDPTATLSAIQNAGATSAP